MNVDEAIEEARQFCQQEPNDMLFAEHIAILLAAEVERLRAELAAAKAASECPVELVALSDAVWQCSVGVKSGADADKLYNWLRERMKDNTPPAT